MAPLLCVLLTLWGLTGAQNITTVGQVSVGVGDRVTIPCLYRTSEYRNHAKYLCKGDTWLGCDDVIKTNSKRTSPGYTISDDRDQGVFTVTIKSQETEYYWCNVEINNGADDGVRFELSVSKGGSELHVEQQEITGFEGENVEVKCQHKKNGKAKKSWCRLGSCPGTQDPSRVTIDRSNNVFFVVTMMDLRMESSGWYMCVYGELNMPVHLTVSKPTTTLPTTTSSTVATFSEVAFSGDTTAEERFWSVLMPVLISLGILLFIISVALLVWWMFHRQAKSKRTAMTGGITVVQQLCIKPRMRCEYHPQSQGMVKRVNGTLKEKIDNICACTELNWSDALPLELMSYCMQTNRITHLTLHEILTERLMPSPVIRGPHKGPPLEKFEMERKAYIEQLTAIHKFLFQREKSRVPETGGDPPRGVEAGDLIYLRVFRTWWNEPGREGPYKVIRATPTVIQVDGNTTWYHLNHYTRAAQPQAEGHQEKDSNEGGSEPEGDNLSSDNRIDQEEAAQEQQRVGNMGTSESGEDLLQHIAGSRNLGHSPEEGGTNNIITTDESDLEQPD